MSTQYADAHVLGIDPGGTTGLCLLAWSADMGYWLHPWQLTGDANTPDGLAGLIESGLPAGFGKLFIACEDFVIGRASTRGPRGGGKLARDLIGAVKTLKHPYVLRTASMVKPWATDSRMALLVPLAGFSGPPPPFRGRPHAKDAARHALYAGVRDLGWPDPAGLTR